MPIRWGDMDAFGHVNNTVYFRYMEQVRISWFEQIGLAGGNRRRAGAGDRECVDGVSQAASVSRAT